MRATFVNVGWYGSDAAHGWDASGAAHGWDASDTAHAWDASDVPPMKIYEIF